MHSVQQSTPAPATASPQAAPVQVPRTSEAMDGIAAKRRELSRQLEDITERREELVDQRDELQTSERGDVDARIKLLDSRSLAIERELIVADDAIAKALANGVKWGAEGPPSGYVTGQSQSEAIEQAVRSATEDAVFGAMAASVTTILALWVGWRGLRRFLFRPKPQTALADQSPRLDAIQQSIDVIALEMERVSEAQRFLTKALTERVPELSAGGASAAKAREERPRR
jgi:hypothetical protein